MFQDFAPFIYQVNANKQLWNFFPQLKQAQNRAQRQESNTILENSVSDVSQENHLRVKKVKLNLTREDLEGESYQNNKKPWSEEEDQLLRHYVQVEKKPWHQIPDLIPNRNQKMCYSRYRRLSLEAKQYWKKAEDQKIIDLVQELGDSAWRQIAIHLQGRSAKQIRQHYLNFLKPDINKDEWTIEQDLKIVDLINLHGQKWKQFQKLMHGRTQNQIKNRFYGRLKKIMMKKQKKRKYRY